MSKSRREHFRKTRRSRMRDLKQSPTGVTAMLCALAALGLCIAAVIISFKYAGEAQYIVGGFGGTGFVLAAGAFVMGLFCRKKEEGIRPLAPNVGVRLGGAMSVVYAVIFVCGSI